jgi:hypothetical protein
MRNRRSQPRMRAIDNIRLSAGRVSSNGLRDVGSRPSDIGSTGLLSPLQINGQKYFDGGLKRNNPILEVIRETHLLYGEHATFRVVLGNGMGKTEPSSMGSGILGFVKQAIWTTTDTKTTANASASIRGFLTID